MEIVHAPECLKDSGFSGSVTIKMPTYTERLRLIGKCQFETKEDGTLDISLKHIAKVADMIEFSEPFIKAVDIKNADNSLVFSSFLDLQNGADQICGKVLQECATVVLNGVQVSGK